MLVIHGVYHFAPRRAAYRNDYCLRCEAVRVAEQIDTFDFLHIFFVPLVPLGRHKRWRCAVCRNNPHERVRSTQAFKVLTAVFFGLFTIFGLVAVVAGRPDDVRGVFFGFTALMAVSFIAAILWCRSTPSVNLKQQLPQVPPLPADVCIYCRGGLDITQFCSRCRVRRVELPQTAQPGIVRW